MESKLLNIDFKDVIKGLLMAIIGAVIGVLLESFEKGEFAINWKLITATALAAGLGYIKMRFLSNNQGQFLMRNKF